MRNNGCPDCARLTSGDCGKHGPLWHGGDGTNVPLMLPQQHGWICPRCARVNAPWVPNCDCKEPAEDRSHE